MVDDDFDPRRDARSRVYEYRILNARAPSPFWRRHAWRVTPPLDVAAMDAAAATLLGEHDFAAFCGADAEPVRSTVRRVLESRVQATQSLLVYRVEATAFLKHMVRNIVGTLVAVGSPSAAPGAGDPRRPRPNPLGAPAPPPASARRPILSPPCARSTSRRLRRT